MSLVDDLRRLRIEKRDTNKKEMCGVEFSNVLCLGTRLKAEAKTLRPNQAPYNCPLALLPELGCEA